MMMLNCIFLLEKGIGYFGIKFKLFNLMFSWFFVKIRVWYKFECWYLIFFKKYYWKEIVVRVLEICFVFFEMVKFCFF